MVGLGARLVVDNRNRFYLYQGGVPGAIVVLDSTGKVLHTFGREGSGPGEYKMVIPVAGYRDSVHIFDVILGRHTFITPDFRVDRTVVFTSQVGLYTPLTPRRWLTVGDIPTPRLVGLPVHIVNDSGRILRSFGADPPRYPYVEGLPDFALRYNAQIWLYYRNRYDLEVWDTTGRKVREYRRRPRWFPEQTSLTEGTEREARLIGLRFDDADLLWSVVRLRRGTASTAEKHRAEGSHTPAIDVLAFDAMIEVLDPASGSRITSRLIKKTLMTSVGRGYYLIFGEDEGTGAPSLTVVRLSLARPKGK